MKVDVAAIVPAYNEEATVGGVVAALKSSPLLAEVIVVDDGSSDETAAVAQASGARVVRKPNGGKGSAVLAGVAATDAPVIALFDADLEGLTSDHVERLLAPVLSGGRVMNCGLRDRGALTPLTSRLPLISGERAMPRDVIERIPPHLLRGFRLEAALNYFCRMNGLPYGAIPMPGLTMRRKYQKVGWKKGLVQYARMTGQVVSAMVSVRLAHARGEF